MNLQELDKMARGCWPPETPAIIGRHETRRAKLQQAQREQQPFTVPREKSDLYGSETPVKPMLSRIWQSIKVQLSDRDNRIEGVTTLAVCAFFAGLILLGWSLLPAAVDERLDSGRQVVAESREVPNDTK